MLPGTQAGAIAQEMSHSLEGARAVMAAQLSPVKKRVAEKVPRGVSKLAELKRAAQQH